MILLLLGILLITYIIYKAFQNDNWTNRGIKAKKQTFIIGDFGDLLLKKKSFFDVIKELYDEFPNER